MEKLDSVLCQGKATAKKAAATGFMAESKAAQMSNLNGFLDIEGTRREMPTGTEAHLRMSIGALKLAVHLTNAQRLGIIEFLCEPTGTIAVAIEDLQCQPLPTRGKKYLELTAAALNVRGAEKTE